MHTRHHDKLEKERKTIQLDEFRHTALNALFIEFIDNTSVPMDMLMDVHKDLEEPSEDFTKETSINVLRRFEMQGKLKDRIHCIRYIQTRNRHSHGDLAYVAYSARASALKNEGADGTLRARVPYNVLAARRIFQLSARRKN